MSEVTNEQLQAEIAELKAQQEIMWQAINSLRQKPPLDTSRLDRVMQDRFNVRPTLARR